MFTTWTVLLSRSLRHTSPHCACAPSSLMSTAQEDNTKSADFVLSSRTMWGIRSACTQGKRLTSACHIHIVNVHLKVLNVAIKNIKCTMNVPFLMPWLAWSLMYRMLRRQGGCYVRRSSSPPVGWPYRRSEPRRSDCCLGTPSSSCRCWWTRSRGRSDFGACLVSCVVPSCPVCCARIDSPLTLLSTSVHKEKARYPNVKLHHEL